MLLCKISKRCNSCWWAAAAAKISLLPAVIASGVNHGNLMPSVCQSRLSDVHTQQSTRSRATLSKMMASGLVASYFILVLEFTKSVHLPVAVYASASGIYCFLQQSYCFFCCMHYMAVDLNLACVQQLTGPVS